METINKQKDFFLTGKTRDLKFRKLQLELFESVLRKNENKLFQAIEKDFGKSKFDTFATELGMLYADLRYYRKNLNRLASPKRKSTNLLNLPGSSYVYKDPLGTVLIIGAWNYPYQLTLGPSIAALAAGNTVVLKPSETAPNTMKAIEELVNENFSSEVFHCEVGDQTVATKLLEEKWDKIFFTGSTRVGKIIYEAAAKHLTPVTLELGGKSPAIVTPSANLKVAAKRIVWGKFLNAGQTCVAPDYLLVHTSIEKELIGELKEALAKAKYEADKPHYTRIINSSHFERLQKLLKGQEVVYGGHANAQTLTIEPTLLKGTTWEDPIMQEEIFGPLLPILTYDSFETALKLLSEKEKPLAAYLFSSKGEEKALFTSKFTFGGGVINDVIMHLANPNLPFGGVGSSGMGNYHGVYGFNTFSHEKAVLKRATWGEPNIKYPPYSEKKLSWIKKFF